MRFDFENKDGQYRYELILDRKWPNYVDIRCYERGFVGGSACMYPIKDGKIIWRHDDYYMHFSQEIKDYINKIIKLKAFL